MFAKENLEKVKRATMIVEMVTSHYFNEDLFVALANYYLKLNDKTKGTTTLNEILKHNPNSQPANTLLVKVKEQ
jgi:Tfp pilus assembly protein PilF